MTNKKREILETLELTRANYKHLLSTIHEKDWNKSSGNSHWSIGELLWHIAFGLQFFEYRINTAKQRRNFNYPKFITDKFNTLITKWGARRSNKELVLAKYERGHKRLVSLLNDIQEEKLLVQTEHNKQVKTIEKLFLMIPEHFKEHAEQIQKGLISKH